MEKEYLESLQAQAMEQKQYLLSLCKQVKEQKVSNFPVLVMTQSLFDIDLGLVVVNPNETDTLFQINLSHLEDFVNKGIVLHDKAKEFIANYKNHPQHLCIFAIEENAKGHFIFLPVAEVKPDLPKPEWN